MKIEEELFSEKERARAPEPTKPDRHIIMPWDSETFRAAWDLWKAYKAEKRSIYKPIGEQSALRKLANEFQTEAAAIAAIEYSMGQNYQGIFPPRNSDYRNGSTKPQSHEQIKADVVRIFNERQAERDRRAAERASTEAGG